MKSAFWDSSSLVPLCVQQLSTSVAKALSAQYDMTVWWSTPVEILGAFARLQRMNRMTPSGRVEAQILLDDMRFSWQEIRPNAQIREQAERMVDRFPLKAADALQLAAATVWCSGRPQGRVFISGDRQLLDAARLLGFEAVEA
jgi:predicted nucleic acid-binding protein